MSQNFIFKCFTDNLWWIYFKSVYILYLNLSVHDTLKAVTKVTLCKLFHSSVLEILFLAVDSCDFIIRKPPLTSSIMTSSKHLSDIMTWQLTLNDVINLQCLIMSFYVKKYFNSKALSLMMSYDVKESFLRKLP